MSGQVGRWEGGRPTEATPRLPSDSKSTPSNIRILPSRNGEENPQKLASAGNPVTSSKTKNCMEVINNALQKNIQTASLRSHKTNLSSLPKWAIYLKHDKKQSKIHQNHLTVPESSWRHGARTKCRAECVHRTPVTVKEEQMVSEVNKWYSYPFRFCHTFYARHTAAYPFSSQVSRHTNNFIY